MRNVGLVGMGRVGTAMAAALQRCGFAVLVARHAQRFCARDLMNTQEVTVLPLEQLVQEADVIFITTPDGVIGEVAAKIKGMALASQAILHMSGSFTSEILSPLREKGVAIGSLHPLQSFATPEQAVVNLPGSYFTYEGDVCLVEWVSQLVRDFGGLLKILPSPETKIIYHAGACIASNYLVALAELGMECLQHAGFAGDEAQQALLPLMQGTLNNISRMSLPQALTGPISRGDLGVVADHVKALEHELPEVQSSYCVLAPVLANMARQSGKLSATQYRELMRIIS